MGNVLINENTMTDIANSIRQKTSRQALMKPAEMPAEIASISGGGAPVEVPEKDVCFYDYDGTRVYSYTLAELQALQSLPTPPTHEGLTSQGWNWTLQGLKAQNSIMDVGAVYITNDGSTRLHIRLFEGHTIPTLMYKQDCTDGTTINWGDGSAQETAHDREVAITHEYTAPGDYLIVITPANNCQITLYGNNSNGLILLSDSNAPNPKNRCFFTSLREIELGRNIKIDSYAFRYATHLRKINLPNGTTFNGSYFFAATESLKCLVLPTANIAVDYLVSSSRGIEKVCLPEGFSSSFSNCFEYCFKLKSLCLPDTVTEMGFNLITNDSQLERLHISKAVTVIKESIARGCCSLRELTIPEGITKINQYAFYQCYSIIEIHLPASLGEVGNYAFDSVGFKKMYINATTPPTIASTSFRNIHDDADIYIPNGCLIDYLNAQYWSSLSSHFVEMDP